MNALASEVLAPSPEIPIERFEIFASGLDHPECLAFDRAGWLWAGGEAGQVYRISPGRALETVAVMDGFSGGLAWSPDDAELFVCNPRHGIVRMKPDGEWSVFATAAGSHRLVCPNYGLFDRRGNYYVTDSGRWQQRSGWLLKFGSNGRGEVVAGPFGYANGLALSADEQYIYLVESDSDRVYRVEVATGAASVWAENVGRMPDGLALDNTGSLLVSCYASDEIHRMSHAGERTLYAWDRWAILLNRPTNMAFGGEYLYVANFGRTTIARARVDRTGKPLANQA